MARGLSSLDAVTEHSASEVHPSSWVDSFLLSITRSCRWVDCVDHRGWLVASPGEGWGPSSDSGEDEQSCDKHSRPGFRVNIRFRFSHVNTRVPIWF